MSGSRSRSEVVATRLQRSLQQLLATSSAVKTAIMTSPDLIDPRLYAAIADSEAPADEGSDEGPVDLTVAAAAAVAAVAAASLLIDEEPAVAAISSAINAEISTGLALKRMLPPPRPARSRHTSPNKETKTRRKAYSQSMVESFLELLCEALAEGRLESSKQVFVRPVFAEIVPRLQEKHSDQQWDIDGLFVFQNNLKKKHKIFLSISEQSGVTYDNETGVISASDSQWAALYHRYGNQAWLKTQGFPRADLYKLAFPLNRPTGERIAEVGDRIDLSSSQNLEGNTQFSDENAVESESDPITPQPALSRRRRRSPSGSSSASQTRKRQVISIDRQQEMPEYLSTLVSSIQTCVTSISSAPNREAGSDDFERAVADGRDRFGLQGRQFVVFSQEMMKTREAIRWNICGDDNEAKKYILDRILGVQED